MCADPNDYLWPHDDPPDAVRAQNAVRGQTAAADQFSQGGTLSCHHYEC